MLQIQGLVKRFDPLPNETDGFLALAGIDLEISTGEFVCVLGVSGCGKTTLLNLIAGFDRPSAGRVMLDGREVTSPGNDRMVCFQDSNEALMPWLTVEENVHFGLRLKGASGRTRVEIADKYLNLVGLSEHRRKFPAQLSGGMRQRLQIARALAIDPTILLMDEPFASLDSLTRRHMHDELLAIWNRTGKTVIFVTHDIGEAVALADRVAIMSRGPGSRIKNIIEIALGRPRDRGDASFGRHYAAIESTIGGELAGVS